jgi:hypothetical protein
MANPLSQIIAAFTSLIIVLIAFSIFGPMLDQVFSPLVLENLMGSAGTALAINASALDLTRTLILVFFKVFAWLIIFAIFARLFIWFGWSTEEQGYS